MKTLDARTRVQLKNILFTTDFSAAAAAALPYAGALAKRFGARLFALHVRTPVINPMTPPEGWPALERAAAEEERERKESLRNALPGVETTVLIEEGDIGMHLPATVKKEHIDLIVLGTRGRTGVGKLMLGSGAEEILRTAECPVLTVGPQAPGIPAKYGEFTRILYATSFGCENPAAAAYAISLAQEFQAELTLLHVLPEPQVGDFVVPQDLLEASKRRLAHLMPPNSNSNTTTSSTVTLQPVFRRCDASQFSADLGVGWLRFSCPPAHMGYCSSWIASPLAPRGSGIWWRTVTLFGECTSSNLACTIAGLCRLRFKVSLASQMRMSSLL